MGLLNVEILGSGPINGSKGIMAKKLSTDAEAKFTSNPILDATTPPIKLPKIKPLEFTRFEVAKAFPCSRGVLILPMREVKETLMYDQEYPHKA